MTNLSLRRCAMGKCRSVRSFCPLRSGSVYVVLVAGACFADLGHDVILVDNDQPKLEALRNGQVPIHEKFLPELLTRHRGQRLTFSDDLMEAVRLSSVIFVAVRTPPTESGEADLSDVESG